MGVLIACKNYKVAIESSAKCNNSRLQYIICGKGKDLNNFKNQVKELGIAKQVHF